MRINQEYEAITLINPSEKVLETIRQHGGKEFEFADGRTDTTHVTVPKEWVAPYESREIMRIPTTNKFKQEVYLIIEKSSADWYGPQGLVPRETIIIREKVIKPDPVSLEQAMQIVKDDPEAWICATWHQKGTPHRVTTQYLHNYIGKDAGYSIEYGTIYKDRRSIPIDTNTPEMRRVINREFCESYNHCEPPPPLQTYKEK